jgi:1-acyl-sn-glycerol-3-phosphate acyltransferase
MSNRDSNGSGGPPSNGNQGRIEGESQGEGPSATEGLDDDPHADPDHDENDENDENDDSFGEGGGVPGPEAAWAVAARARAGEPSGLDDSYLGAEAAVPPGEYAPISFSSVGDPYGAQMAEMAELERRIHADRTPAFPMDLRRHLPLEALWRRWRSLAMWGRSDIVDDFGRDPKATARWEWFLEFLYSMWFRVECEGLENVPSKGRAVLVANHAGTLPYDSLMLVHAVRRDHRSRRDVRPLVEDPVFHLPFLGPIMNRIGGVRADPDNAERLLLRDELVAVFPEGEKGMGKLWRDRYRLQRFGRGGFVRLALRTGSPIIPVAIVGAEEAAPMVGKITWFAKNMGLPWVPITMTFPWLGPAGLLPLPSKWKLRFGKPIDVAASYGRAAADDRLLVNRVADEIRSSIQASVNDLLGTRRSPILPAFFG